MKLQSTRVRALALVLALTATTFTLPLGATGSEAPPAFAEDWEDGLDGWTVTGAGASADCAAGSPGCSLLLDVPCCSNYTRVSRAVDIPLTAATELRFRFHATDKSGDTDTHLRVRLDDGTTTTLSFTDGVGQNTGLALLVSGQRNQLFGHWGSSHTWYEAALTLDPVEALAQAHVQSLDGTLVALSSPVAIPATANAISSIEMESVSWTERKVTYRYDSLAMDAGDIKKIPGAPRNFSVRPGDGNITLTWDAPAFTGSGPITEYRIYRARDQYAPRTLHATLAADVHAYVDANLPDSSRFVYWVAATNAEGPGPVSDHRYGWTWGAPYYPYDVRAGHAASGNLIDWKNNGDNGYPVTEWRVYRADETGAFHYIGSSPADNRTYLDATRPDNATWTYRVTAVNFKGEGGASKSTPVTTGMPPHPVNLKARAHPDRVTLTWSPHPEASAVPVTHYVIERNSWDQNGYNWEGAAFTTPATSFEDYAINLSRYYEYTVRAVGSLPSYPSDEARAWPPGGPSEPRNLRAERTTFYDVELTWDAPLENPDKVWNYIIYRGVDGAEPTWHTSVDPETLSFNDTWVELDHTYTYVIEASPGWIDDEPLLSNAVTVNVTSTPFPPRNLTATGLFGEVWLAWDPPAIENPAFAYQYCIYRSTVLPEEPERLVECIWRDWSDPEIDYVDRAVLPGLTYTYRVTSLDYWHGEGVPSEPATATALPPFPAWPLT